MWTMWHAKWLATLSNKSSEYNHITSTLFVHCLHSVNRVNTFLSDSHRDAIEFLVNEGFIYSTIDDDHFKSTNG